MLRFSEINVQISQLNNIKSLREDWHLKQFCGKQVSDEIMNLKFTL